MYALMPGFKKASRETQNLKSESHEERICFYRVGYTVLVSYNCPVPERVIFPAEICELH